MEGPRVALFGGSFNPPHFAHQMIVAWLLNTDQADEVWLVPCWSHVFGKEMEPFNHRYTMCLQAAELFPGRCKVSNIEGMLGGESKTLRTVRELKRRLPGYRFSLVIGTDNWWRRRKWHRFDLIEKECPIIVVGKRNQPRLPDIRSTKIRSLLMAGKDVSPFVSARVLSYIRAHGLYSSE